MERRWLYPAHPALELMNILEFSILPHSADVNAGIYGSRLVPSGWSWPDSDHSRFDILLPKSAIFCACMITNRVKHLIRTSSRKLSDHGRAFHVQIAESVKDAHQPDIARSMEH